MKKDQQVWTKDTTDATAATTMTSYQLHQVTQLSDGFWEAVQPIVAGLENP